MCRLEFTAYLQDTLDIKPVSYDHYVKAFVRDRNGERREWLGDAVLGMVASEYLFRRFPGVSEGVLSKARVKLVKGKTLSRFALELGLDKHIRLDGTVTEITEKVLADTFEALVATMYLDPGAGMKAVSNMCCTMFKLHFTDETLITDSNAKDIVSKCCRETGLPQALYETEKTSTTPYEFLTIAYSEPFYAVGYSKSKKDAEQIAAASLAEKIASKYKQVSQYVHITRDTVKKARRAEY